VLSSFLHPAPPHPSGSGTTAFLLLDLALVVVLARLLGNVANRFRQPRAVGEIVAGLLLGPTLIGRDLSFYVVPREVRPAISGIATLALVLFMFRVGVEFNRAAVRGREGPAVVLGLLSVAVPVVLGFPVAAAMHTSRYAGPTGASLLPFSLFIGACLSVTALPVIGHVLLERGEINSRSGAVALAAAAVASVAMFAYIGLTSAVIDARGYGPFLIKLVVVAGAAILVRRFLRPAVRRLLRSTRRAPGGLTGDGMAVVFGGLLLCALLAEVIGINAMVGAFVWGVVMPSATGFRLWLTERLGHVASVLLLPVFFAFAGLSADLRLITPTTLPVLALVLAAAVASKFLAALPGRFYGMGWREVGSLAALMNTRGLVLLVVGLIGLDLQVITAATYTIVVVVALVTNVMTGPLMDLWAARSDAAPSVPAPSPAPVARDRA
jgi:Kef-type K+ transport system membrane component KefB